MIQVEQLFARLRSEEHTSELQSLMRISYALFCLKKKKKNNIITIIISVHSITINTTPTTQLSHKLLSIHNTTNSTIIQPHNTCNNHQNPIRIIHHILHKNHRHNNAHSLHS